MLTQIPLRTRENLALNRQGGGWNLRPAWRGRGCLAQEHRKRSGIRVLCRNGKSSPLTPSLADWLTLQAPSVVFEGDSIDLMCQKEKDWWEIQTMAYYKDGKELQLSNKVSDFSIPRAALSDGGSYYCSATAKKYFFLKSRTSRSIRIEVQGKTFPPVGAGLDETGAQQGGSLEGTPAPTPDGNQSPVV